MRTDGVVFGIVGLLLAGGAGRLAHLEYSRGDDLRRQASRQHRASVSIAARRGDILDAKGRVLAGSLRRPSVFVDPSLLGDPRFAAYSIAPVLGLDPEKLLAQLTEKSDDLFRWVKRELSDEELAAFQEVRETRRLGAFGVQYESHRVYPFGSMGAHVIGFVSADQRGLAGVEQQFDGELIGTPGTRTAVVDVRRRRLQDVPDECTPPIDGASLVLTLDAHLQQRAEYHLRSAVEQYKAKWGAAVLVDPRSGEVLAMACCPTFDPAQPLPPGALSEKQQADALERVRNRSISDSFEPGSIFKPYMVAMALESKLARLDEVFAINGPARQFGSRTIHDTHTYGSLALWEVVSKSSNIGMGMLGARLGNERLYRFVRSYGYGDPTGIELPGEHTGLVNDFSRWGPFTTQSIPIGQELAVTPLQIVTAFSVFCNDGLLIRPRMVRGVVSAAGETLLDRSQPIVVRRVLSPDVAREFRRRALGEVVLSGTGKKAALADYFVFGKTGTAQVARAGGGGYIPNAYVGSFVAGAPMTDPRVAVVVSIYMPGGREYYGGTVAAPTAGAILADALEYIKVPPEPPPQSKGAGLSGD